MSKLSHLGVGPTYPPCYASKDGGRKRRRPTSEWHGVSAPKRRLIRKPAGRVLTRGKLMAGQRNGSFSLWCSGGWYVRYAVISRLSWLLRRQWSIDCPRLCLLCFTILPDGAGCVLQQPVVQQGKRRERRATHKHSKPGCLSPHPPTPPPPHRHHPITLISPQIVRG